MSFHSNYAKWLKKTDPQHCPVCRNDPMVAGMVDLVELPHSWLNAQPIDCLRGACSVTAKYHGPELFDLTDDQLCGLVREIAVYSKALKTATGAVKINVEFHGNTEPHLHAHLYPRYLDDPFPGQAIDYSQKKDWYGPGRFEVFCRELREEVLSLANER